MLIVDAFNVLHTTGILPPDLADPGVPGLIRLIARSRYAARDLTIVCDGGGGTGDSGIRLGHAMVLYSGFGREADDVIESLIERYHRGNSLEVVSSDARLRRAARKKKASSLTSELFLEHLALDARAPQKARGHVFREQVPLDPFSVAAWLTEFGVQDHGRAVEPQTPEKTSPAPFIETEANGRTASSPPKRRPPKKRPKTTPPGSTIGTRLAIPKLPAPAEPEIRAETTPKVPVDEPPRLETDQQSTMPSRTDAGNAAPSIGESNLVGVDPLLIQAMQEWRDRLRLDDLDMQQWAPDATPIQKHGSKGDKRRKR